MNHLIGDLKRLQELDDQISGDKKALAEGETCLAEAAARLKTFEDRLKALKDDRERMSSRHRELEALMADLSLKKSANEKRQLAVKNDNEYTALLKEAEYLNSNINQAEDEALELLDRLERREIEINDQSSLLREEATLFAAFAAETEKAMSTGRSRLADLQRQRQELFASLPSLQGRQYEDLHQKKGGRAVSPAADGMCLTCRLSFPPQVFNELQRNEKIIVCPNCGRIIYWREHPDFKSDEK